MAFVPDSLDVDAAHRAIDSMAASGARFAGAPLAVKEIAAVTGMERRCGSRLPGEAFSQREGSLVARLRGLGFVPVGLAVSTEFAYFDTGPTVNPHNPGHTPGGSSSGSAAAVASGMVPLALGTQTIGSVIRPAAFCGIVGFKPTMDLLPRDGFLSFSRTVDHIGMFTSDVAGLRAVCEALSVLPGNAPHLGAPRLAAVTGSYLEQAEPAARVAFDATIDSLRAGGLAIEEHDPFGDIDRINAPHRLICAREFYHAHAALFDRYGDLYRAASRGMYEQGAAVAPAEYDAALDARDEAIAASLREDAERPTIWLSPAACGPAPAGIGATGNPIMNLPWTYLGRPTITVPAGVDPASGLPLGLQLSGPRNADMLVIDTGATIESLIAGATR